MNSTNDNNPPCATIDAQVIQSLRELGGEDDPGLLKELIEMFLQDAPKRIGEIQTALAENDIKLLERAAHTLKSSSANLGAMGLSRICREIEEHARKRESAAIPALYAESTRVYQDVASALRSISN